MTTPNRVFVEIFPHSLQVAVIAGRRLVACGDYSLEEKDALVAFLAANEVKQVALTLVSPLQPLARLVGQEEIGVRSEEGLLACVQTLCANPTSPLSAVACDAATGKPVDPAGQEPWLMAGTTAQSLTAARDQLAALGLPVSALTALALPAQLGSVVAALQDMPESARVAVLTLGENESVLGLVSAAGVEAVRLVAVGFIQIYEAVQLELGLKFRAAAPKLFFNASYDFADTADKIAAHLAVPLRAALGEFTDAPGILHVVGLPAKQEWLGRSLGQALGMAEWAPDTAKICSQLEMEVSAEITPSANTLRLIQLAAGKDAGKVAWLPFSMGNRPALPVATVPVAALPKKTVVAPLKPSPPPKPAPPAAAPAKPPVVKAPVAPVATVPLSENLPPVQVEAAPVAVAASPKRPWAIYGAAAAVVLAVVLGLAAKLFFGGKDAAAADTAVATDSVVPGAKIITKFPAAFSNESYSFEITQQGVLSKFCLADGRQLVDAVGLTNLQGSYLDDDGRRIQFSSDGLGNADGKATVSQATSLDGPVYKIRVDHPRFRMEQSVVCLPTSLKVSVTFTPLNLREQRGAVSAIYSVKLNPALLNPAVQVGIAENVFSFSTVAGVLRLKHDDTSWARFGSKGRQTVTVTDTSVGFSYVQLYSSEMTAAEAKTLDYELVGP